MRIAILGASHWHVDLYYVPALSECDVEIVALHDPDPDALARVCEGLQCPRYTDHLKLLDSARPDLVFAHAPHAQMPAMADDLITRHQPFHMEKPMGVDWRSVDAVAVKAQTQQVWTSVALVSRYYGLITALRKIKDAGDLGNPCHFYHSLFAGSPLRYEDWGVGWMLDPELAGGGALWNFSSHIIDLFLYLVDADITTVQCATSNTVHHLQIDDMATIEMTGASGATGIGQVSYTMPTSYERFFSFTTDKLHCGGASMGEGKVLMRDGSEVEFEGPDSDTVYSAYVKDTLARLAAGEPAMATIKDMARTIRIMDAARTSALKGEAIDLQPT